MLEPLAFLSSCVSSPFLKHLVDYLKSANPTRKFEFFVTPTGFKYLANKADSLVKLHNYQIVIAYEEALGIKYFLA